VTLRTAPRHRKAPSAPRSGGADGNARLTAMTGAMLLLLLAAEGVTILLKTRLLGPHFFIGMLLAGPVLVKLGSTTYRFARYYTGSPAYVAKGPPSPLLRLLGPVVIITSVGVIGSGIALAFARPGPSLWLAAHKAFFLLWFAAMSVHVLAYAPKLPGLLRGRVGSTLTGAGRRWLLLTAGLAAGLIAAAASYHLAGPWTAWLARGGG
jgi:hypothetical protein